MDDHYEEKEKKIQNSEGSTLPNSEEYKKEENKKEKNKKKENKIEKNKIEENKKKGSKKEENKKEENNIITNDTINIAKNSKSAKYTNKNSKQIDSFIQRKANRKKNFKNEELSSASSKPKNDDNFDNKIYEGIDDAKIQKLENENNKIINIDEAIEIDSIKKYEINDIKKIKFKKEDGENNQRKNQRLNLLMEYKNILPNYV